MAVEKITTRPFADQKPGTAGLRKKVSVIRQPHYLENFLQSIFDCMPELRGETLVIGGDGRFHNATAIRTAIAMAAANGVGRIVVGAGGLLSTPAASNLIRVTNAAGGFVLTASHNPAGPDGDFGIKVNVRGGGQAAEGLTERIHARSKTITEYSIEQNLQIDLNSIGLQSLGHLEVEVVDPVAAYADLMQQLFDCDRIRRWLTQGNGLRFDAMHAVTGPYARRILVEQLGAPANSVMNASPLEDFGGHHPDPNLRYASHLLTLSNSEDSPALIGASDGDGDRNMILGKGIFISPGDSLAMLAAHLHKLPGYRDGLVGVARSMPTSRAVDQVAKARQLPCFETPTGWKFFANLLDHDRITLCGEESFGTSSRHTREKDGLWAVLAWLNVLAVTGKSVAEIAQAHWQQYGRHYYQRHDYENLSGPEATEVMQHLAGQLADLPGKTFGDWTITQADEFSYQDPIDGSLAVNQGLRVVFGDAARIILRLSGTGTGGATLRLYLERYEREPGRLNWVPEEALSPLVNVAEELCHLGKITGRSAPSLVT